MGNKAFTVSELIITTMCTVILVSIVFNFYSIANVAYTSGLTTQALQDGANVILSKIMDGKSEPGGVFRLSEGVSYSIPNAGELHYIGVDNIERSYRLNADATALIYNHPTSEGVRDEVVYTAPKGATLVLRFIFPAVPNPTIVVQIDAAIIQKIKNVTGGRNVSGSASTIVNLRNHS